MRVRCVLVCLGLLAAVPVPATASAVPVAGRPVYVTNSGRSFDGTLGPHNVAVFAGGAALTPLGEPVPAGAGARGIVFAPSGRFAYATATDEGVVYPYRVGRRGELTQLGTPVTTGGASPFGIALAPDGRTLYTANIAVHTVSTFAVGGDGTLTPLGAPVATGLLNPRNLAVSLDGRFLFVSHGTPLDTVPDAIVVFPRLPDGSLGPSGAPIPTGGAGTGFALTPDGASLYLACSATDGIYGFHIGPDGSLSALPGSPYPVPKTPEGVTLSPDGRHLYVSAVATRPVLSPEDQGIWTFAVGSDGALTPAGPPLRGIAGPGLAMTPDGRRLYVSDFFTNLVSTLDIDPATGSLSDVARIMSGATRRPSTRSRCCRTRGRPRG
ncbi:MAG TPA: beta-propeller fold lactonase family protein [Actinophytocola sp.]|uniref:lactonase family protein n=1 Tax=Actinophytocola sp. TaxID=1872138 RepID=UPI002DF9EBB4|nr:beta-propeller fold lactonase family protein [Actinophytocola sp.]